MSQPIRVITADGHQLFREALARPIRQRSAFQLVGEVPDGRAAVAAIVRMTPDVAVVRVQPPQLDCRVILRALGRRCLPTRVLLVGDADKPDRMYEALADGAAGWITPAATPEQLCSAIVLVARGDIYLTPEIHHGLAREIQLRSRDNRTLLSTREQQMLERLATGQSGPQIAKELHIATGTVRTHVAHLYDKLGVGDRAAAVAEGMRRGLLD